MSPAISEVFDTLSEDVTSERGSCIGLEAYDVVAHGQLGGYAEVAVVLDNHCAGADIELNAVELVDREGAFSIVSELPEFIPAGGSVEITLGFEAVAEIIHEGELRLFLDDDYSPFQTAQLFGLVSDPGFRSGAAPHASSGGGIFSVTTGASATLDASGSTDPESDALTYSWSIKSVPGGSSVTNSSIAASTNATTSYTPDVDGAYKIRLVVSDSTSIDKTFADYTATSGGLNTAPTANAGASLRVQPGEAATLDGSGSTDPEGDVLSYTWTLHSAPGGSALTSASISGANTASASITPDVDGSFICKLVVNDGMFNSSAFVSVRSKSNTAPVADGGANITLTLGQTAVMDGSASYDLDGEDISYSWSFADQPKGSILTKSDIVNRTSAKANFVPDTIGQFRVRLTVLDAYTQDADFIYVTVN